MPEPLAYIAPWRAVLLTAERGGISAGQAALLLGEAIDGGEIEPEWPDGRPAGARSDEIDWRAGLLRRRLRLQTRALADEWEVPAYTEHPRVWPIRLRRGDVEALIAERFSAPSSQNDDPSGPLQSKTEQLEPRMARFLAERGAPALAAIPVKQLGPQFGATRTLAVEIRNKLLGGARPAVLLSGKRKIDFRKRTPRPPGTPTRGRPPHAATVEAARSAQPMQPSRLLLGRRGGARRGRA